MAPPRGFPLVRPLDRSASADEVDQEHHQSDHEQQVNQAAGYVEDAPSQKPGNQQDYREPDQHDVPPENGSSTSPNDLNLGTLLQQVCERTHT